MNYRKGELVPETGFCSGELLGVLVEHGGGGPRGRSK